MSNLDRIIKKGMEKNKRLADIYNGLGSKTGKIEFYRAVLSLIEKGEISNVLICFCGHDCSKCLVFRATLFDDDSLRKKSAEYYKSEFGQDIPEDKFYCLSGRSDEIMDGCRQCPYMKCCGEQAVDRCQECGQYPCKSIDWYMQKYINKANQI